MLYINDIVNIHGSSNIVLYADDTNIFFSGVDIHDLFGRAKKWLKGLDMWLKSNKLYLNVDKTKYLLFKPKGMTLPSNFKLEFQDSFIQQSSTIRFLGVLFHENLSWTPHIDSLIGNLCRAVGLLNRLRYYLPQKAKRQIYFALIHSRISYCLLVWSSTSQTNLDRLLSIQKRALRAIGNIDFFRNATPYFRAYQILNLRDLQKYKLSLEIWRQFHTDKLLFHAKYPVKIGPYNLRQNVIMKSRSRTNYGDQKLSFQIPDFLNKHPTILDFLNSARSPLSYKKSVKEILFTDE